MRLERPDPGYTASRRARHNFGLAMRLTGLFIAVMWAVFLIELVTGLELAGLGLRPREAIGLIGLVTTPLLHANLAHIASNTVPLFIGGAAMLFLYPNSAVKALPTIYLGSAALAWLVGRSSIHIGASGLVYGILAYVFVSGILRRDLRSVGVSLLIWFLYGSMVWGVLPIHSGSSWELHACGSVIGIVLAFVFRHQDQPPMKRYDWEWEEDLEDEFGDDEVQGDIPSNRHGDRER